MLVRLFPNHLLFPNVALQAIFQYDRMREILDAEEFRYFLMSQVDFCVPSTANYLPIIAFELDSPYHDAAHQVERDERKNKVFRRGGVPLLRLRPFGKPTPDAIREEIIKAVRMLGEQLSATYEKAGLGVNLTMEINFERFGMEQKPCSCEGGHG